MLSPLKTKLGKPLIGSLTNLEKMDTQSSFDPSAFFNFNNAPIMTIVDGLSQRTLHRGWKAGDR
jgi:hypothetical protein